MSVINGEYAKKLERNIFFCLQGQGMQHEPSHCLLTVESTSSKEDTVKLNSFVIIVKIDDQSFLTKQPDDL